MTDAGVMSRSQAGILSSAFFFTYMIFQSVSAIALRKADPIITIGIAAAASALVNAAMPMAARGPFLAACALWGAHGALQSAVWPCVVRLLTEGLPPGRLPRAMVLLNTSGSVGTALTYLATAWGVKAFSWQSAFYVPAALLLAAAIIWTARMPRLPGDVNAMAELPKARAAGPPPDALPQPADAETRAPLLPLVSFGVLAMLFLAAVNGFLRDGITAWLPTYIQDTFSVPASTAIFLSILIPATKTVGPFVAGRLLAAAKSHALACAVGMAVTLVSLCAVALWGSSSLPLTLACLSLCAVMVVALNTEIVCLYPLVFHKRGMTAQASSVINSFVYVGSVAGSAAFGFLADARGWQAVTILLCVLTGASLAASLAMLGWERHRERRAAAPLRPMAFAENEASHQ
jgi:OPA family glycerol-3-phosphate transporter-like MFS transporter